MLLFPKNNNYKKVLHSWVSTESNKLLPLLSFTTEYSHNSFGKSNFLNKNQNFEILSAPQIVRALLAPALVGRGLFWCGCTNLITTLFELTLLGKPRCCILACGQTFWKRRKIQVSRKEVSDRKFMQHSESCKSLPVTWKILTKLSCKIWVNGKLFTHKF